MAETYTTGLAAYLDHLQSLRTYRDDPELEALWGMMPKADLLLAATMGPDKRVDWPTEISAALKAAIVSTGIELETERSRKESFDGSGISRKGNILSCEVNAFAVQVEKELRPV